jgi:hypothetical protein
VLPGQSRQAVSGGLPPYVEWDVPSEDDIEPVRRRPAPVGPGQSQQAVSRGQQPSAGKHPAARQPPVAPRVCLPWTAAEDEMLARGEQPPNRTENACNIRLSRMFGTPRSRARSKVVSEEGTGEEDAGPDAQGSAKTQKKKKPREKGCDAPATQQRPRRDDDADPPAGGGRPHGDPSPGRRGGDVGETGAAGGGEPEPFVGDFYWNPDGDFDYPNFDLTMDDIARHFPACV